MVIACYSIDSSVSLANIQDVWIPEVKQTNPDVPIVLVATKSDLKDQLGPEQIVTPEQEERVANAIGAIGHVQASALTTENVKTIFDICIAGYGSIGTIYKTPNGLLPYQLTPTGSPDAKDLRLLVIGDSACGKTSLLINYKDGKPATQDELAYIPTIFETYNCFVTNKEIGKTYNLTLQDTAGQGDFKDLRTPVYAEIDMVIACYSIDSSVSLANIQDVWIPEVKQTKPDVPIVLVATKSDLKDQLGPEQIVTPEQEERVANAIGAIALEQFTKHQTVSCHTS
ncbi:unnamed protein product [Ambrosiozyma monospora]|uniref:Unnamed protein product n=1 Tax=Ambrosiozyma monospora TaxID=43982 RepID=A0A9W6WMR8_AMBMO|nr:unnamed protein product [Ambrosiozyma monospora]